MKQKPIPNEVVALMTQVAAAANGDTENNVVTFISYSMWKKWKKGTAGFPGPCNRIYGSEVRVIETPGLWAISVHRKNIPPDFA